MTFKEILAIKRTIKVIEDTLDLVFLEEKDLRSLDVDKEMEITLVISSSKSYRSFYTLFFIPSRMTTTEKLKEFSSTLKNHFSHISPREMFLGVYLDYPDQYVITIGKFLVLEEII